MGLIEKIGNAFFQSVTTRTAGFNTIDVGNIKTPTALCHGSHVYWRCTIECCRWYKGYNFVIATIAIFNTIRKEKTTLYLIEKYQKDTYSCLS